MVYGSNQVIKLMAWRSNLFSITPQPGFQVGIFLKMKVSIIRWENQLKDISYMWWYAYVTKLVIVGEVKRGLLRRSKRCLWGLDISDMTVLSWHTHQQFFRSLKKLLICTCYQKSVSEHKTYFDLVRRINTNLVTSGSFISMHISPILGASIVLIPTIIEQIKWGEYKM